MQLLLVTFVLVVALRFLYERRYSQRQATSLGAVIKDEIAALLITLLVMAGVFLLALVLTLFFGPLPQIHEL